VSFSKSWVASISALVKRFFKLLNASCVAFPYINS
jgi:hypothetical protein